MKSFIEVYFSGIDNKYLENAAFELKNEYFSSLEILASDRFIFYFKDDILLIPSSRDNYLEECRKILFRIYIQMKKQSKYNMKDIFAGVFVKEISINYIDDINKLISVNEKIKLEENIIVERKKENKEIDEEEFIEEQRKIKFDEIKLLLDMDLKISDDNLRMLNAVLCIEEPVLRYMMMYSLLYELCGNKQEYTYEFIKESNTFKILGVEPKFKNRVTTKGKEIEEDVITYYRNIIGHSYKNIFEFKEPQALSEIEILKDKLLLILIEKMESDFNV